VAIVAGASLTLEPILHRVPAAGLVAAVLLVAWSCGFGPAMLATAIAGAVLAAPPYEGQGHSVAAHLTDIALFVTVSTAIAWLASARRRLDQERLVLLQRQRAAAAEAARLALAKDHFLATVSHELRSPLTAILGWVHVLRRLVAADGDVGRAIDTIERSTRLQARLIEDLLDASRAAEGKLRLSRRRLDLVPLLRQIADAYRPAARAKGIHFVDRIAAESLPLLADSERIQQVVSNVLSNAIKFTPAEGRVTLVLEPAGAIARIVVSDTGVGIDHDVLPYVFERFHQGASELSHAGLGLGLAIVKDLVTLHGGAVRAESEGRGRGATFTIELPMAEWERNFPSAAARA
jgi:signal transduction histidine kinase